MAGGSVGFSDIATYPLTEEVEKAIESISKVDIESANYYRRKIVYDGIDHKIKCASISIKEAINIVQSNNGIIDRKDLFINLFRELIIGVCNQISADKRNEDISFIIDACKSLISECETDEDQER